MKDKGEKPTLNISIVKKEAFCAIGKVGRGQANLGPKWIHSLWEKANGNFNEISHLVKYNETGKPAGIWGLMSDIDEQFRCWGAEGKYLAGCEVKDGSIVPPGWTLWKIPSQTYVVATCKSETYGQVFNFILKEYIPNNGYEIIGAVHEYYPQNAEKGVLHQYFPIEKN